MKLITKVAAIALLLLALAPALAAGAQTCEDEPEYCESVNNDGAGADTDVAPSSGENTDVAPSSGENEVSRGGPGGGGTNPDRGAATAPAGPLPITGGDIVGMAVIGAVAVGLGAVLVRRAKGNQAA